MVTTVHESRLGSKTQIENQLFVF